MAIEYRNGIYTSKDSPFNYFYSEKNLPAPLNSYALARRCAISLPEGSIAAQQAQDESIEIFDFVRQASLASPDLKEIAPGIHRLRRNIFLEYEAVEASFIMTNSEEYGGEKLLIIIQGLNSLFEVSQDGAKTKYHAFEWDGRKETIKDIKSYDVVHNATTTDSAFYRKVAERAFKIEEVNLTSGLPANL